MCKATPPSLEPHPGWPWAQLWSVETPLLGVGDQKWDCSRAGDPTLDRGRGWCSLCLLNVLLVLEEGSRDPLLFTPVSKDSLPCGLCPWLGIEG